jgi:hypothetical protein
LFQFAGVAEQWLSDNNWASFRSWAHHPDSEAVITELEAAKSLTPALGEEYQRYQRARPARLSPAELATIRALASDIPALWAAPTTTVADLRLIRAVIESVQVTAEGAPPSQQATSP